MCRDTLLEHVSRRASFIEPFPPRTSSDANGVTRQADSPTYNLHSVKVIVVPEWGHVYP